jgi:hypothetical protein
MPSCVDLLMLEIKEVGEKRMNQRRRLIPVNNMRQCRMRVHLGIMFVFMFMLSLRSLRRA